jgi:hypothetical protein
MLNSILIIAFLIINNPVAVIGRPFEDSEKQIEEKATPRGAEERERKAQARATKEEEARN